VLSACTNNCRSLRPTWIQRYLNNGNDASVT
jgi:hypothetical protein